MFKEMRRKDSEIFNEDIEEILIQGEYGTLSTISEDGYPYAVPLSYIYYDKCIYFHGAKEGNKHQNIENNNKVSFCVVTDTQVLPSEFTTKYKSVVAFGIASEATDDVKETVLFELIKKYSPEFLEEGKKYIQKGKNYTKIVKIDIKHITGKARN